MSDTMAQRGSSYSPKSSPFLNEVRKVIHLKHMGRRTEAAYLHYIIDFSRFCGKRHPQGDDQHRWPVAESEGKAPDR